MFYYSAFPGGGGSSRGNIVKAIRPGQSVAPTPIKPGQPLSEGASASGMSGLKSPGGLATRSLRGDMPMSAALNSSFTMPSGGGGGTGAAATHGSAASSESRRGSSHTRQAPVGVEQPDTATHSFTTTSSNSSSGYRSQRSADSPHHHRRGDRSTGTNMPPASDAPSEDERRARRHGRNRQPKNYAAPQDVVVVDTAEQNIPDQV